MRLVDNKVFLAGGSRQDGQAHRSHKPAQRVNPTHDVAAAECGQDSGNQQNIFRLLPLLINIGRDHALAPFWLRTDAAQDVIQAAHWTDPATEEAP